jgi:hypothetical protein
MAEAPKEVFIVVADVSGELDPLDWCPPRRTREEAEESGSDCPEPHRVVRYVRAEDGDE